MTYAYCTYIYTLCDSKIANFGPSEPSSALRGLKGKPSNLDWPLLSQQHCSPLFVALPETTYAHSNRPSINIAAAWRATAQLLWDQSTIFLVISHPSFLLLDVLDILMFIPNISSYLIISHHFEVLIRVEPTASPQNPSILSSPVMLPLRPALQRVP